MLLVLTSFCAVHAQSYTVHFNRVDSSKEQNVVLQSSFASKNEAGLYILRLPALLRTKGYITASVDSIRYDSLSAEVSLYLGEQYRWTKVNTRKEDEELLQLVHWPSQIFSGPVDYPLIQTWEQRILDHLEERGHPFGKVFLDSMNIEGDGLSATLKIIPGPVYKIDSIVIHGDAHVTNEFLQRYLDLPNGSPYNRKKLDGISKKLSALSYIQEEKSADLSLLGTGSVLNLYLKARKTSQVNVLIGFHPNSDQLSGSKMLITADVNVLLRNTFGSGETVGLVWQQLQQKSPRLNLLYDQPYAFHSPFGLNFSLDMYKKDSSFLNINMNLGTSYRLQEKQTLSVFLQRRQSIVSDINTETVMITKQLPPEADVSSLNLGIGYDFYNTDIRFNPRKGNEFFVTSTAGSKKIRKNNEIVDLVDPSDPSYDYEKLYDTVKLHAYQFRIVTTAAHFLPLGTQSTIKLGFSGGIYQSENYFRNELFQIGGIKLLRGFDEESQYVSQYAIGTIEYRYRLGLNSYFFGFADGGWGKHLLETVQYHRYFGTGVGLSFETKAGIVNLAWAVGKRDDTQLNLRQSKVHIGFASYF
ncbi:MAG: hypothetical protein ACJ75B_17395 [Flavisolibacter sp.]